MVLGPVPPCRRGTRPAVARRARRRPLRLPRRAACPPARRAARGFAGVPCGCPRARRRPAWATAGRAGSRAAWSGSTAAREPCGRACARRPHGLPVVLRRHALAGVPGACR
ncbi:hypothetical protein FNH09_12035 [Streptomyces adustus]|uniref:Uncharacterized protein n=1 Tax=Streptomyces adustus TaxID=1609272 RepID=A0A5N8VD61_9ACTN|nr:hypothetical protein [Streptomyces adustus]